MRGRATNRRCAPDSAILVIGAEPPPATGMEIVMQALLEELRRSGVPYVRLDTADPSDELENRGRWTFHNAALAVRHLVHGVRKTARRDVAAVYLPIAQDFPALFRDLAFILSARLFRKPMIVHLHGGAFGDYYRSLPVAARRALDAIYGGVALGIVLTERLRPALECVLPPNRVVVVSNGIDIPEDAATDGTTASDEDGATRVLFFSSLFPSKGVLVYLEALALARAQRPELKGVVAGTWPSPELEEQVVGTVGRLGLVDHVELVGPVHGAAKTALLRSADVFCFPSFYPLEGQPLVVIEAMAAGLPVVATAWRGIADTVVDGETGLLVATPSPELVAEKLVQLAADDEERRRMGAAGRRRYEEMYTQRAFGDQMVRLLDAFLPAERMQAREVTAP